MIHDDKDGQAFTGLIEDRNFENVLCNTLKIESWRAESNFAARENMSGVILSYSFTDITVVQTLYNSTFKMQTFPTFQVYKHFDQRGELYPGRNVYIGEFIIQSANRYTTDFELFRHIAEDYIHFDAATNTCPSCLDEYRISCFFRLD